VFDLFIYLLLVIRNTMGMAHLKIIVLFQLQMLYNGKWDGYIVSMQGFKGGCHSLLGSTILEFTLRQWQKPSTSVTTTKKLRWNLSKFLSQISCGCFNHYSKLVNTMKQDLSFMHVKKKSRVSFSALWHVLYERQT
jgi:hypothetical protein